MRWERTYSPSGPIIRLAFTSPYTEAFAAACAEVRALPPLERKWIPRERCWHLTIAGARALAQRWPLVAQLLAAEDAGGREEQHRQQRGHPPAQSPVPADIAAAFALLCLTTSAPPELVAAARRVHASRAHPDAGGAHHAMVAVNTAADRALAWLARRSPVRSSVRAHV